MKKMILNCCVIFLTSLLSAQQVRISITPTSNVFHNKSVFDKTYGSPKLGLSTSVDYLFITNKKIEFGLGIGYQSSSVLNLIRVSITDYQVTQEKINLFSISVKSNYKLSKDFYLSLDPLIDFQINYDTLQTTDNQSGLGLSFGVGGNFRVNNVLSFNVEPRLWMHNIIPFHNLDQPFRLSFVGINLGLVFGHKID